MSFSGRYFTLSTATYRCSDRVTVDLNSASENGYNVAVESGGQTTSLTLQDDPSLHPGEETESGDPGDEDSETGEGNGGLSSEEYRLIVYVNSPGTA